MRALPVILSMFVAAASAHAQVVVYTPRDRDSRVPAYNNTSLARAEARQAVGTARGTVSVFGTVSAAPVASVATVTPMALGTAPCDVPGVVSTPVAGTSAAVDAVMVTLVGPPVSPYARVIPSLPQVTGAVNVVAPVATAPALAVTLPVGAAREAAARDYDAAVRTLALKANEIDLQWRRFNDACVQRTAVNPGPDRNPSPNRRDRGWFALLSNDVTAPDQDDCRQQGAALTRVATDWRNTMMLVEDAARSNDVLPGAMREIRQRYRVEF